MSVCGRGKIDPSDSAFVGNNISVMGCPKGEGMTPLNREEPRIVGPLPGPRTPPGWSGIDRSCPRRTPGRIRWWCAVRYGAMVEDMDGNRFLDFTAGIAVTNVGHSHPQVVAAIRRQASRLIHMSGTDFYYAPQVRLAERLAALAPGRATSGSSSPTAVPRRSRPR